MFEIQTLNLTAAVIWCLDHPQYKPSRLWPWHICSCRNNPKPIGVEPKKIHDSYGSACHISYDSDFPRKTFNIQAFQTRIHRRLHFHSKEINNTLIPGTDSQDFDLPVENQAMHIVYWCILYIFPLTCHTYTHLRCTQEWFFMILPALSQVTSHRFNYHHLDIRSHNTILSIPSSIISHLFLYIICLGQLSYFTNLNSSAIWGWFPLLTMMRSEKKTVRSLNHPSVIHPRRTRGSASHGARGLANRWKIWPQKPWYRRNLRILVLFPKMRGKNTSHTVMLGSIK